MSRRQYPSSGESVTTFGARSIRALLIVGAFLPHGSSLTAQINGSLAGIVRDDLSSSVLEGATVSAAGTGVATVTDSLGQFRLPSLPEGRIDLRVTLSGYASVVESIDVSPTDVAFVRVRLPPLDAMLREVLVIGGVAQPPTGAAIAEVQPRSTASRSALDLLGEVPGVVVSSTPGRLNGGVRIQIRGSSSLLKNDPAIYLDGILISGSRSGSAGTHALELIPAKQVERIQVLRGPSAAAPQAHASSGVILVETEGAR